MSETTVGYPTGVTGGVAAYVREVRAELADLPTEDIDDLTGGMEADLSELAAECGGDLARRLGPPGLYAAELRAAAGLPERVPGPVRRQPVADALTGARASWTTLTDQRPWLRSVAAFLVTLRPAWWLIRGYLAAWAVWGIFGINQGFRPLGLTGYALALLAIVVSVQLGRGWLRQWELLRPLIVVGNAVAIVLALTVLFSGAGSYHDVGNDGPAVAPGVALDGEQVTNIYAYDSNGRRITGVRLFDQAGRPFNTAQSSVDANGNPVALDLYGNGVAVVRDTSGAALLNVYPQMLFGPDPWRVTDSANPIDPAASPQLWSPPMAIVPLAPGALATSTPSAAPTAPAAASPTASPTVSPTARPTTSATSKSTAPATERTPKSGVEPALPTPSGVPTRP